MEQLPSPVSQAFLHRLTFYLFPSLLRVPAPSPCPQPIEEAPPGKEDESLISESIPERVKMMDELPDPLAPPRSINKIGFQAPNFHAGETGCTHGMGDPSFGT